MIIKPVNTANLEQLLTRIWSGELEHDQDDFFCGTSCCLAGWDVALHYPDAYEEYKLGEKLWEIEGNTKPFYDPWGWSKRNNNLTHTESHLLFYSQTTRYLHKTVLEAFKEGRRLLLEDGRCVGMRRARRTPKGIQAVCYNNGRVTIFTHEKDKQAVTEFLGDYNEAMIQVKLH